MLNATAFHRAIAIGVMVMLRNALRVRMRFDLCLSRVRD